MLAVASTKAYSVQVAVMYLIAFRFALVSGKITEAQAQEYTKELMSTSGNTIW